MASMAKTFHRVRNTAVEAAIRVRTEMPVGLFFMAVAAGYLAICIATYVGTAR